eukprot:8539380-Karenia_brevis.AAC.1
MTAAACAVAVAAAATWTAPATATTTTATMTTMMFHIQGRRSQRVRNTFVHRHTSSYRFRLLLRADDDVDDVDDD